jgi:hypothetical protein
MPGRNRAIARAFVRGLTGRSYRRPDPPRERRAGHRANPLRGRCGRSGSASSWARAELETGPSLPCQAASRDRRRVTKNAANAAMTTTARSAATTRRPVRLSITHPLYPSSLERCGSKSVPSRTQTRAFATARAWRNATAEPFRKTALIQRASQSEIIQWAVTFCCGCSAFPSRF